MPNLQFRAWNKTTNTMVDLKKITPFALHPDLNQDGVFLPFSDDYIIMQFTGMTDGNGTPIYEGDLIKFTSKKKKKVTHRPYSYVAWQEEKLRWVLTLLPVIPDSHILAPLHIRASDTDANKCGQHKVIGNIYADADKFKELQGNG